MSQRTLVVKGSGGGGLGDRIKSVLVGIIYAKLSSRKLFVDWNDGVYAPQRTNAFNALFELVNVPALDTLSSSTLASTSVKPAAWKHRLANTMHDVWTQDGHTEWDRVEAIQQYSFDLSKLDYNEDILVLWEFDQLCKLREHLGSTQSGDEFFQHTLQKVLEKHLRLNAGLQKTIGAFTNTHFKNRTIIGVHIRASNEYQNQKGQTDIQQYLKAISKIRQKKPEALVFLATDNDAVISAISTVHPQTIIREKWFAKSGEPLHLNSDCPDILRNANDALIEMFLLARCDYLVRPSVSSFSFISDLASFARPENKIRIQANKTLVARASSKIRDAIGI